MHRLVSQASGESEEVKDTTSALRKLLELGRQEQHTEKKKPTM